MKNIVKNKVNMRESVFTAKLLLSFRSSRLRARNDYSANPSIPNMQP